jgi:hypothetical protein
MANDAYIKLLGDIMNIGTWRNIRDRKSKIKRVLDRIL